MATILIIDDAADVRDTLRTILEMSGHRVIEAADGRAGIAAYAAERPGLVVTDLNMPGMNGIATVTALFTADPNARVIVMTGSGDPPGALPPELKGRITWMTKPFRRATLLEAIAQVLGHRA